MDAKSPYLLSMLSLKPSQCIWIYVLQTDYCYVNKYDLHAALLYAMTICYDVQSLICNFYISIHATLATYS